MPVPADTIANVIFEAFKTIPIGTKVTGIQIQHTPRPNGTVATVSVPVTGLVYLDPSVALVIAKAVGQALSQFIP